MPAAAGLERRHASGSRSTLRSLAFLATRSRMMASDETESDCTTSELGPYDTRSSDPVKALTNKRESAPSVPPALDEPPLRPAWPVSTYGGTSGRQALTQSWAILSEKAPVNSRRCIAAPPPPEPPGPPAASSAAGPSPVCASDASPHSSIPSASGVAPPRLAAGSADLASERSRSTTSASPSPKSSSLAPPLAPPLASRAPSSSSSSAAAAAISRARWSAASSEGRACTRWWRERGFTARVITCEALGAPAPTLATTPSVSSPDSPSLLRNRMLAFVAPSLKR
mmetsp:Transcript_14747/g.34738  ORF Transcript_14747/g.34738 Transcript_14747/m.34738 type:complete len:284 (-) Transcript_14747:667-1518(-)